MDYLSDCAYDSSGRFLMAVSKNTNSLKIFNSYGKIIYKYTFNSLNQVLWRNRPHIDIPKNKLDEVNTKFKDYKKIYEA